MRALITAIALVFVVGATLPAVADAGAKDYAYRFGGIQLRAFTNLDEDCGVPCDVGYTFHVAGWLRTSDRSGKKLHPLIHSVRVTIWKDLPGQRWDKKVKSRTWRDVRLGKDNHQGSGSEFLVIARCDDEDPIGTAYYTKTRTKKTKTARAVWVVSKPRVLRFHCAP